MAQERDLTAAEPLDFNFNIEDTNDGGENQLDDFLNSEESVNGNTEGITPSVNTDLNTTTIPGAPKPNKSKKSDNIQSVKPDNSSTEEQEEVNKRREEEDDFNSYLDKDESDENNKSKLIKKPDISTDPDEIETSDEEDEGIKTFAEELYKMGFFTKENDDEEIPVTPEELKQKLEDEKQRGAEQLVYELAGRHGEDFRKAFDAMFVNGVNPKEYLAKLTEIQSFKDLDMTIEDNQARVIENGLRRQGWDEDDISAEVQRLKNNSDLETVSGRYHKALVKSEEAGLKKLEETAKIQNERLEVLDKQYYTNLNSILGKAIKEKEINGIPLTKELAQKAFGIAYVKRWTLPKSKEEITDLERIFLESKKPENHEFRTQLAVLLAQTFDGWEAGKKLSLDLSKIQKKAVSNESGDLFHALVRNKKQNSVSNKNSKTTAENYSF